MRGKVMLSSMFTPAFRITPAYAGKRVIYNGKCKYKQDHPRLCGEKLIFVV